ncbi:Defensin [Frankliniella fusca]|uniref:Defensin n=1 Tax=Frankliniella fusca TaxID=407009 RepID=A0AAE1I4D8_9NEOP|nr:Defensin [Frankliniella fusca]
MKSFTVVVVALAVLIAALHQGGAEQHIETEDHLSPEIPEAPYVEVRAGRHARATCDLLSFSSKWVTPNHAACAAHCIAMLKGFKGGYCKNTVCHCRK